MQILLLFECELNLLPSRVRGGGNGSFRIEKTGKGYLKQEAKVGQVWWLTTAVSVFEKLRQQNPSCTSSVCATRDFYKGKGSQCYTEKPTGRCSALLAPAVRSGWWYYPRYLGYIWKHFYIKLKGFFFCFLFF